MLFKAKDHTNKQYNSWTALRFVRREGGITFWLCRCNCGLEVVRSIKSIQYGRSKSCHPCSMTLNSQKPHDAIKLTWGHGMKEGEKFVLKLGTDLPATTYTVLGTRPKRKRRPILIMEDGTEIY